MTSAAVATPNASRRPGRTRSSTDSIRIDFDEVPPNAGWEMGGLDAHEIDDGTGKIWVATEKYGVPSKDTYIGVTGRVVPGVTWGGRSYGNGMRETRRRTRETR